MDLSDLKRHAIAAREFAVPVGAQDAPRHITLRLPTQHEVVLAARRSGLHGVEEDAAAHIVLQRALLQLAMVAWAGVVVGDVLPGHPEAAQPLEWSAGAAELLLDAQTDWAHTLGNALMERMAERKAAKDTAAKN